MYNKCFHAIFSIRKMFLHVFQAPHLAPQGGGVLLVDIGCCGVVGSAAAGFYVNKVQRMSRSKDSQTTFHIAHPVPQGQARHVELGVQNAERNTARAGVATLKIFS